MMLCEILASISTVAFVMGAWYLYRACRLMEKSNDLFDQEGYLDFEDKVARFTAAADQSLDDAKETPNEYRN